MRRPKRLTGKRCDQTKHPPCKWAHPGDELNHAIETPQLVDVIKWPIICVQTHPGDHDPKTQDGYP